MGSPRKSIDHNIDKRHVSSSLRLVAGRKLSRSGEKIGGPMDAFPSTDDLHSSRDGSEPRRGESGSASSPAPSTALVDSRDQLLARRRAAQRAWRSACERAERASRYLREALTAPHSLAAATARERLEYAQRGERQARSFYYRVAEETGALLSRLDRTDVRIVR